MRRRLFGVTTTVFMLLAYSLPALAQDIEPAIPIEDPAETVTVAEWTYRFLIPTALVLAVLVIVMTSIRYFTNVVRKRYRIVEE